MRPILPGITTIEQHLAQLSSNPESYRPENCPHCYKSGLHCHGCYTRQSDREHGGRKSLNPVSIPRFLLSFLQTNLFNASRMPCAKTMVSMAYPAGGSAHGAERLFLRPNYA